jgi:hypothetical protein
MSFAKQFLAARCSAQKGEMRSALQLSVSHDGTCRLSF